MTYVLTRSRSGRFNDMKNCLLKKANPLPQDVAHNFGNPLFALETNLDPLMKRIQEGRTAEALEIVENMRISIEQLKAVVKDFS